MTTNRSTYGTAGALSLVAAAAVWSIAVALQESGANPDALIQGMGYVSLALLAVGMVALLKMMFDIYGSQEL